MRVARIPRGGKAGLRQGGDQGIQRDPYLRKSGARTAPCTRALRQGPSSLTQHQILTSKFKASGTSHAVGATDHPPYFPPVQKISQHSFTPIHSTSHPSSSVSTIYPPSSVAPHLDHIRASCITLPCTHAAPLRSSVRDHSTPPYITVCSRARVYQRALAHGS